MDIAKIIKNLIEKRDNLESLGKNSDSIQIKIDELVELLPKAKVVNDAETELFMARIYA